MAKMAKKTRRKRLINNENAASISRFKPSEDGVKNDDELQRSLVQGFFRNLRARNGEEAKRIIGKITDINATCQPEELNIETTMLVQAIRYGETEIVCLLLEKGADVNITDRYRHTALMWAIEGKNAEIVKLLLEHGANAYAQDMWDKTITDYAEESENPDIIGMIDTWKKLQVLESFCKRVQSS
jgi:ankyrin repeat protein